jgi:Na+/H+ antiporter NhaD/arsenite permease-like protein
MGSDFLGPSPWSVLPFLVLLLAMALGPLLFPQAWARHYPKIAFCLAALTVAYYLLGLRDFSRVQHVAHEYVSFIVLIGALFVVSGGIHINVKGEAKPGVNVIYLLIGALAANVLGTTGASMLLIRPWIRMNKHRVAAHHIVFFIFIVSNVGGCLTPVGDPPLFLGYLKGIPFWWVAQHCWPMWSIAVGLLLVLFYVIDSVNYRRAPKKVRAALEDTHEEWRFEGLGNILFLLVILGAVFVKHPIFGREGLMLAAAAGSWFTTKKSIHTANHFNFHPIEEVAILFFGIFATMMPALDLVQANAHWLGRPTPGLFYWGCGLLSSVLDNAPTYLTFLSATLGLSAPSQNGPGLMGEIDLGPLLGDPELTRFLVAISIGAVFFGANTYIGNAPNFMVKSIADHQKVPTPGFISFLVKYAVPCMGPVLVLIWLIFFTGSH